MFGVQVLRNEKTIADRKGDSLLLCKAKKKLFLPLKDGYKKNGRSAQDVESEREREDEEDGRETPSQLKHHFSSFSDLARGVAKQFSLLPFLISISQFPRKLART